MKKILLIVTGSIAAYKIPFLVRKLKQNQYDVTCILTKNAEKFVTKDTLEVLSERKVYQDLFAQEQVNMDHINLSRDNDLILVAPASANIIFKMASGVADDLASACLLASNKQIIIAPAMNGQMLENFAVKRNMQILQDNNIKIIPTDQDILACKEYSYGKMADIDNIFEFIKNYNF